MTARIEATTRTALDLSAYLETAGRLVLPWPIVWDVLLGEIYGSGDDDQIRAALAVCPGSPDWMPTAIVRSEKRGLVLSSGEPSTVTAIPARRHLHFTNTGEISGLMGIDDQATHRNVRAVLAFLATATVDPESEATNYGPLDLEGLHLILSSCNDAMERQQAAIDAHNEEFGR